MVGRQSASNPRTPHHVTTRASACEVALPECMVRRRVASEKRRMAVGLRQCIRPLVEPVTPGHDGYPLALVLINWTAWKRPFPISGFESVGETHCHLYFPPADLAGTVSPKQGFYVVPVETGA